MDKHKKMSTQRHSIWSITINNPTPADEEDIARARQKGWKVEGQLEKGENGTPHYQLMVSSGQVRFSAVKKAFPRAHIEPARNPVALKQYVEKEDTKIGELTSESKHYPSLSKFWKLVYQTIDKWNYIDWTDGLPENWFKDAYDGEGYKRECKGKMYEEFVCRVFESAVNDLIRRGYHVENFYSPPNISVFKKFHFSILRRSFDEIGAETARQTDMRLNEEEQTLHINIPTTDADDDEEEFSEETDKSSQASP